MLVKMLNNNSENNQKLGQKYFNLYEQDQHRSPDQLPLWKLRLNLTLTLSPRVILCHYGWYYLGQEAPKAVGDKDLTSQDVPSGLTFE